jgi:two-component system, sensor histidine kinase
MAKKRSRAMLCPRAPGQETVDHAILATVQRAGREKIVSNETRPKPLLELKAVHMGAEPRPVDPAREDAVSKREEQALAREGAVKIREEHASQREAAICAQEEAARSKMKNEAVRMDQLREANENLVIATLHSQEAIEAAERVSRHQEHFLAMLAHELRNPLAPIVNALAVLHQVPTPEPSVTWGHDIIKRQVAHITRLLDDLLDVSRLTTGKIVLQKAPVAVKDFMAGAVEVVQSLVRNRSQHLKLDIPDEILVVDGDPVRLVQVFSNLLNNAVKYTPIDGNISFSAARRGDSVVLRVADDGCGIAAEALPDIFNLFAQEGRSLGRADGGLGIGLSIVRGMVEMHGGSVTASSRGPGEGCEFLVMLPLVHGNASEAGRGGDARAPLLAIHVRVVLIDDNVDASDSLSALLQLTGCDVSCALDGLVGVALVHANRPQIVICDIGLPGMGGYEVIAQLRKKMSPMPRMIALTGYGQAEDRARSIAAGFDHHLVKPVDPEALLRLLAEEAERLSST